MDIRAVNERDIEMTKTNHGLTKFLRRSEGGPSIMIRHWGPENDIPVHSHSFNDMLHALEGELEMGGASHPAGSCIYIPKGVPYGPTRAPRGLKFSDTRRRAEWYGDY